MKINAMVLSCVVLLGSICPLRAQEGPNFFGPLPEHKFLEQLAGEWESELALTMDPDPNKPAVKLKGTGSARLIGKLWVVSEGKTNLLGIPFTSILTIGFDPGKKKYVATWVDSNSNHLRVYEGALDAKGKVLTLETEIPLPHAPGKMARFKEVFEFKSKDHQVVTSSLQMEGKWVTLVTVHSYRKKETAQDASKK